MKKNCCYPSYYLVYLRINIFINTGAFLEMPRQNKGKNFTDEYERLCIIHNLPPLSLITANLKDGFIDINADRIRCNEWEPFLGALKVNNSIRFIAVRSYWETSALDPTVKTVVQRKIPSVASKDTVNRITRALKECLISSSCLECLILQNIKLSDTSVVHIVKGLDQSSSIRHLSLEHCFIGDRLFKGLSASIKLSASLISVNFTGCGLEWKSAEELATLIKYQATQRHGEAWKDSLRYRRPDLDRMRGLRRITLCKNKIGDTGARILSDALKDDLWLKALDLQDCDITADGATILKESLRYNKTIVVLDLRNNPLVAHELLRSVIEQVMMNAGGEHSEYPWITRKEHDEKRNTRKTTRRKKCSKLARNKNRDIQDLSMRHLTTDHYPWRTALRTKRNRFRLKNPLDVTQSEPFTAMKAFRKSKRSLENKSCLQVNENHAVIDDPNQDNEPCIETRRVTLSKKYSLQKSPVRLSSKPSRNNVSFQCKDLPLDEDFHEAPPPKDKDDIRLRVIEELHNEVQYYQEKLEEERQHRLRVDNKLKQLERENTSLKQEIQAAKKYQMNEQSPSRNPLIPSGLDDDKVLDSIESSFRQFQQFLDMLKDMGLGDLYEKMNQPEKEERGSMDRYSS